MFIGIGLALQRRGGAGGKTYADFVAHITTLATNGSVDWTSNPASRGGYRTTAAAAGGQMIGSSWVNIFSHPASDACRIIQHGLPSQAVFDAQIAAGRQIYFRTSTGFSAPFDAVSRNGYTSLSGGSDAFDELEEIIYWDGTQAQRMTPKTGGGPALYTW